MRSRILLFGAAALLIISTFGGGAASARPQEGFELTANAPVEKDYGPMGPGCPACTNRATNGGNGLATLPSTAQCGGNYQHCDAIPIQIVPPANMADDRDIFFTIVELHWDGAAGNDLDLQFYDNAQSTGSFEQMGASVSTKNPETLRVANADLTDYNIVVINYSGANTGYKIKARISTDPFSSPSEAVAPDPPKQPEPEAEEEEAEEEDEVITPEDFSGGSTGSSDANLPPVGDIGGDSDFDFGFSDLDSRISVQPDDFAAGAGDPTPTAIDTVSPAVLLASLVGAPALVVGSGAAFVWKRRRDLLI